MIAQSDSQSTTVFSVNSQKSSETSTSRVQNSFTQAEAHLSLFNKQDAATRAEIFYLLELIKSILIVSYLKILKMLVV